MEINDLTRSALIRKGNELFNQKDIDGAYNFCLTNASSYRRSFSEIYKASRRFAFKIKYF